MPFRKPLKYFMFATLIAAFLQMAAVVVFCQVIVDKTVATVSDGLRTELITYSDLKWQLALQPNTQLSPIGSDDLNLALQLLINQRIFALEAERLPRRAPTEAETQKKIAEILAFFPTASEFENRLKTVGFTSVKDDNFEQIIARRVAIDKFLDFRFRSFVVVTTEDESNYYREIYVPDYRRRFPGVLMPTLEEKRREINEILTEERIAVAIETFLDEAKRRVEIVILSEV